MPQESKLKNNTEQQKTQKVKPPIEFMKLKTTWGQKILEFVTVLHHVVWTLAGLMIILFLGLGIVILPQFTPGYAEHQCVEQILGKERTDKLYDGGQFTDEEAAKVERCFTKNKPVE